MMSRAEQEKNDNGGFSDFELLISHLFNGGTMAQWEGRSPQSVELFHFAAIKLYNAGKYDEAHLVFHELMRLDHRKPAHAFGLAACLHKMKQYIPAANVYLSAILLDPSALNIEPSFHIAECLISANTSLDKAEEYLEHVISRCPEEGELAELKPIAKAKLELLKKNHPQKQKTAKKASKQNTSKKK